MSKGPILVIMAAGLGSRFGGNKQITPVDEHGQLIIDYSIYDAVRAGFETVVCVIKPENEKAFHDAIGARIAEFVDLKYAYQSLDMVPEGFVIPEGREKPWGTGHAAMCAKEYIDRPFAVINADDYYGRSAFETMAQYLMNATDPTEHVMVGYKVENTLTENGTVSRGQCMTKDGMLTSVIERTSIIPQEGGAAYTEDDGKTYTFIPAGTIVSMNMWGFMPSVVPKMEAYFKDFLRDLLPARPLKAEYYLPSIPNRMLEEGSGTVRVLETSEKWYGVTYREDLPRVKAAIAQMKAEGKYPDELWKKAEAKDIVKRFTTDSAIVTCERYGNGHINETYLAVSGSGRRYILQKINNKVFQNVEGLMNNISSVTAYLAKNDPDPHHTLHLVPTQDGRCYTGNDIDGYWRLYDFVEDSICLEKVESKEDFYQSAVAFGMFQRQLAEFPAETLTETIVNFHNTADRVRQLKEAIANNKAGRLGEVGPEIEFALARAEEAGCMVKMLADGELPLRVTHNDTKLNNVMLDAVKRTPMCVIDLDTVMPGLAANDFGDSIRFGASTAAEDEKDLSKVEMSLELFEAYARGFLSACGSSLTEKEIETLPMGAKLMTYECGIRFLADYLNGDVYFRVHYPEHNLDRTRTQFKLVADMESKWDKMAEIIKKVAAETNGNC